MAKPLRYLHCISNYTLKQHFSSGLSLFLHDGYFSRLCSQPFYQTKKSVSRLTFFTGGDDGIRTHDPLVANEVLSQLSHAPTA